VHGTIVEFAQLLSVCWQEAPPYHVVKCERSPIRASPTPRPSKHLHASVLSARHIVRTISRSGKVRRTVLVPGKLLRADSPLAPPTHVVPHTVVHDPVFASIGTCSEAGVTHAISLFRRVLVEDAAFVVLLPVSWVHRIFTNQFELTEAVVAVVATSGGVNDEFLACLGVCELLWAFVRCEAVVFTTAVRGLFPSIFGHTAEAFVSIRNNMTVDTWSLPDDLSLGEVRCDSPWVVHLSDTEICGPGGVCMIPIAISSAARTASFVTQ
jgi:hypothetical protein